MTLTAVIFWIIVAILAYFLIQISLTILIIVIVAIVIWYLVNWFISRGTPNNQHAREGYESQFPVHYTNAYLIQPTETTYDIVPQQEDLGNATGHENYWYIPIQDYYDEKQNNKISPTSCVVPGSTSEYCVNKQLQETGDIDLSIARCSVPSRCSVSCTT
jgi:hypothetical protein